MPRALWVGLQIHCPRWWVLTVDRENDSTLFLNAPSTPWTIWRLTVLWEPNFMNIFTSSATDRGQAWDLNLMACNVPNVPPDILRWEALETVWKLPWWLLPPPPCRKSVVLPLMAISVCCLDSLRGMPVKMTVLLVAVHTSACHLPRFAVCFSNRTFPCCGSYICLSPTPSSFGFCLCLFSAFAHLHAN